jgi:serine/threonine protein kinase/Flp pilus assembly protein TadD
MAASYSKRTGPSTFLRGPAARSCADDPVVAALCDEMRRRWAAGDMVCAEAIFDRKPDLRRQPELALEIIYEEICLRQERGEGGCFETLARRFPEWEDQLAVMRDCHRLLEAPSGGPRFPEAGETVADFHLLKALGRGAGGRVFLARQPKLADRPVVVKFTAIQGHEHLNLARLQHTHIVPLYAVVDDHDRNLRILCMPYFGGITLDRVLETLTDTAQAAAAGHTPGCLANILRAAGVEVTGPAEATLSQLSYEKGICWIGMCLAEALHYAHESGLVHFDIKPANVLMAADGQPMLLDFHLAQPPLQAGGPLPAHLGGTAGYMPPEQAAALAAMEEGTALAAPVDRRADIYALGAILYQALGGELPYRAGVSRPLERVNPRVSRGLSDIVAKCLAAEVSSRYRDAAALAEDLRRHAQDLPLLGVRNRSWRERYAKWRRRHPSAVRMLLLVSVALIAVFGLAGGLIAQRRHLLREAHFALEEGGKTWRERQHYKEARALLQKGLDSARQIPWSGDLPSEFNNELRQLGQAESAAQRADVLRQLHELADSVRALYGTTLYPSKRLDELQASCQSFWDQRHVLKQWLKSAGTAEASNDLLDLALFAVELRVQRAAPLDKKAAGQDALAALDEVEELFGPSLVLRQERRRHRLALGLPAPAAPGGMPAAKSAWEHCLLGRSALQAGELEQASGHLSRALALEPAGFWPNFYQGQCCYRLGRHDEALAAFSVCIGSSPGVAAAYYNRALCYTARQDTDAAFRDYDFALKLDPKLAAAALNRGMLHFEAKRFPEAERDLRRALECGANPATVHYDLAMVQLATHDQTAAIASLENALRYEPNHEPALGLLKKLHSAKGPHAGQK